MNYRRLARELVHAAIWCAAILTVIHFIYTGRP